MNQVEGSFGPQNLIFSFLISVPIVDFVSVIPPSPVLSCIICGIWVWSYFEDFTKLELVYEISFADRVLSNGASIKFH